jgi:hypothetical protein
MKIIVSEVINNVERDNEADGKPDGETADIDEGIGFLTPDISESDG